MIDGPIKDVSNEKHGLFRSGVFARTESIGLIYLSRRI